MATENQKKVKFDRVYHGYNPQKFKGPTTLIVDTVVLPVKSKETP